MQVVVATRNNHKLDEIRKILSLPEVELVSTEKWADVEDPIEDGTTFEENALIKARAWAAATGLCSLADDSGLEVEALNGKPGIHSARYAGTHGDSAANNKKLLCEMDGVTNRSARFVCVVAVAMPNGEEWFVRGECRGRILSELRGNSGFGYDPLFIPNGFSVSFAELDAKVKDACSHRADALKKVKELWREKF